mmetsp:Transcript_50042/g.69459  ORF Transcript_50042/g.69459 Transcript_50042/m.69459 type:complete len:81 (-) Transcript_50042:197-439(-)
MCTFLVARGRVCGVQKGAKVSQQGKNFLRRKSNSKLTQFQLDSHNNICHHNGSPTMDGDPLHQVRPEHLQCCLQKVTVFL